MGLVLAGLRLTCSASAASRLIRRAIACSEVLPGVVDLAGEEGRVPDRDVQARLLRADVDERHRAGLSVSRSRRVRERPRVAERERVDVHDLGRDARRLHQRQVLGDLRALRGRE